MYEERWLFLHTIFALSYKTVTTNWTLLLSVTGVRLQI